MERLKRKETAQDIPRITRNTDGSSKDTYQSQYENKDVVRGHEKYGRSYDYGKRESINEQNIRTQSNWEENKEEER